MLDRVDVVGVLQSWIGRSNNNTSLLLLLLLGRAHQCDDGVSFDYMD